MRTFAAVSAVLLAPVLAVTPLPATAPAVPGVVLEVEVRTMGSSAEPEVTRMVIEGQNIKAQTPGSGNQPDEMIFKGASREMMIIDHGRRSYTVIDEATLKSLAAQMSDAMSQMEAALANVPPEQRAMVEQMMRGRLGGAAAAPKPETELRATGERAEHSGYPTRRFDVLVDGTKKRELWVTDWNNVEGLSEAQSAFEGMAAYMKDLLDILATSPIGRNLGDVDRSGFEYLTEMDGFPIVTREFSGGNLQSESTVREIRSETVPAGAFDPPAGYSRQAMGG